MDFVFSVISALFVALLLATALAFGLVMLAWIMVGMAALTLCLFIQAKIRHWLFMRRSSIQRPKSSPDVIDVEYKDISDD